MVAWPLYLGWYIGLLRADLVIMYRDLRTPEEISCHQFQTILLGKAVLVTYTIRYNSRGTASLGFLGHNLENVGAKVNSEEILQGLGVGPGFAKISIRKKFLY